MRSSDASDGAELRIVCGPTAAGKSAIALSLAERHGLTIVSADSRQIYRGFDIGTAKPTAAERARVSHRGVDVAEPTERWSAARWSADAAEWLEEAHGRALVVGGTGFYIGALLAPLFEAPTIDPARRAALGDHLAALGTEALRRWVRTLDAPRAHLGRAQLLRAAETALLTGTRVSDLHRSAARRPRFRARWLLVDPGARLHEHIERRIDQMLANGWADEVAALAERLPDDAPAWKACGYEILRRFVRGEIGSGAAREAILIATRQYAKRQRTWFRHQIQGGAVTSVDPHHPHVGTLVDAWWSRGEHE